MSAAERDTIPSPPPSGIYPVAEPPIKQCSCGLTYTRAEWDALVFVGRQDDGVELLELRNCPCTSTISIVLERAP